jgi:dTMP kinase
VAAGGLFISFEGIDGAGKSTHIDALAQAFTHAGRTVLRTREPGGTPLAEKLREIILNDAMDALTEALLIFAARRDHLQQVIEPALERGDVVLCDRFTDASFAYQGYGRGFSLDSLSFLEQTTQQIRRLDAKNTGYAAAGALRQPDLTLWFDLPPEVAAQRLTQARAPDKFEAQNAEFFTRVAAGYAARAAAAPQRFARVNAHQAREAVWGEVRAVFSAKGWLA